MACLDAQGAGPAIFTATLASILFTVLGMGCGIHGMLNRYQAFDTGGDLADDIELLADRRGSSLLKFDRMYIKPVFCRESPERSFSIMGDDSAEGASDGDDGGVTRTGALLKTHSDWRQGRESLER